VVLAPWQIALTAYALIALAFLFDMVTPQALNAEVLYAIPIVLAAFSASRQLTYRLVLLAILADELGAIGDAALASFHWDVIGIENRFLSLISLAVVAALTLAVQDAAARIGSFSAIEAQRRRHAALSYAADHILASLGGGALDLAIVQEASRVLEQTTVYWCPSCPQEDCWIIEDGLSRQASRSGMPPELGAVAGSPRTARSPEILSLGEPPRRTSELTARSVLAIPIADSTNFMGTLLAPLADSPRDLGLLVIAASFANLIVGALQQERLISDLAAQNRRLNEKQGVIQGLIDAIAHDLRTPLAALSVTLQQAGDGAYGDLPAEYGAVLRESKNSIDEISRLAETLLLVARLESGAQRDLRARVRLDAIVRELASEFGAMASARGVGIVTRASEEAIAQGARGDVRRAIANLVANAIAHTPSGGTVELCARKIEGGVEVSVADDGYGIDEQHRGSLFERFSRAAQSGTGSGLGLYIVRRVAEEMGGNVHYEPRRPRGSTFTLSFPVAA
jgi:signal transduction histidine kinase